MTSVLTIAGSDPTGGAGLELDLRVFQHHGLHGMALATSLTVQDSQAVRGQRVLDASFFAERLQVLLADMRPDVIKIGMLGSEAIVAAVVEGLRRYASAIPVVLDPVLRSSSGHPLLDEGGLLRLRRELLPLSYAVCPNRGEAELLVGAVLPPEELAESLAALGPELVCITGGDADELRARDHVRIEGRLEVLERDRIPGASPHGTGCALSSALSARLALGHPPLEALRLAKDFVAEAIAAAERMGGPDGKPLLRFGGER